MNIFCQSAIQHEYLLPPGILIPFQLTSRNMEKTYMQEEVEHFVSTQAFLK